MKRIPVIMIFTMIIVLAACTDDRSKAQKAKAANTTPVTRAQEGDPITEPLITFIELGSVKCIPCKKMQPVMRSIEEKYREQVKIIFYDVWKADQKQYAQQYGIRLIPTQVFLDRDGREIFRHEGFFPEAEIDRFLQEQGLKPVQER